MQEVPTILLNGSIVRGRYVVEAMLGKGGFGVVYLVRDLRVKGNRFALKEVIDPKKEDREHFLFEGEVLRRLDHPALPRVYRVFEDDEHLRVYLLMDYVEGPNLEKLRKQQPEKRFPLPEALRMLSPIVEALTYLHHLEPPIVHRDIKPSNIIVPPGGEDPVLVDFGIAKEYVQNSTTSAIRKLSPSYSAPEQYTQGTNPRTDVYGLAATLYTLLSGTLPIDSFQRIVLSGEQDIDPLERLDNLVPSLPASVAEAVQQAMALDIDTRFASVQEFWDALQSASPLLLPAQEVHSPVQAPTPNEASLEPSTTSTVRVYKHLPVTPSRKRGLLALLLLFLILIVLIFGFLFRATFFPTRQPLSHVTATTVSQPPATHIPHPTPTVPTPTPTLTPTSQLSPTPTSAYPSLASSYTGTIHNDSANINGNIALTQIQQSGANMSGNLQLTNGLSGQSNFSGTMVADKTFSFIVTPYVQYLPLLFQGQVNADGTLSGKYCSERNNQCDYSSGGYGTWNATP